MNSAAASARESVIWPHRHLLGLEELSADEITLILDTAAAFEDVSTRSVKKVPALRGRVVVNLFFEDSTRTRTSFTLAAQRLSADVIDFTAKTSAVNKGESLRDTVRNIEAMGVDIIVCRHGSSGAPHLIAKNVACCVINAGDGRHEHPTQGLLDIYTIRKVKRNIAGLKIAIVGDINNSRVARSDLHGLLKLGAEVTFVGPPTLVSGAFEKLGARVAHDFDSIIGEFDVINMLRVQRERISSNVFPSIQEYSRLFGLTNERMRRARPDVLVMHPGPINRGVELAGEVADGPNSVILEQVTNGLAVRMAVMFLCKQASESH
ncbi:MAG: aspartate carbamoyltransferase catalytic subunit [Phycisphaerales bacterium]|nr:aspartate carbamoyltransferase catalytic subunit [Phycisphaerales bacterium]MCB9862460.1 aspartate carbamoyltransferase catalytic subunit [Phycisphaerales bacterium]